MRLALLLRPDADARPGGDVVQARAVARYLRMRGVVVEEVRTWGADLAGFDRAVLMNLTVPEQAWLHARACTRASVPYLLLPVFWDLAGAVPEGHRPTGSRMLPVGSRRRGSAQRLRLTVRDPLAVLATSRERTGWYFSRRDHELVVDVVRHAAAVLPNSHAELEHLAAFVGVRPDERWRVAWNGLWADEMPSLPDAAAATREDVILSVGAISPRKNTLGLVRAAAQVGHKVVIVGQAPRAGDSYAERVLREAPGNVEFAGLLPREAVLQRLLHARAHVQPGFVETPGLASLEALALCTPIVVSRTAPVEEYFGQDAVYADPADPGSIAAAIRTALGQPPRVEQAARIRRDFDWPLALQPLGALLGVDAAS